jgi:estrogen-related receptor beta like 1
VAAALEDVKQQLENLGSNLTDASPLVRLKAAMSSLREELKGMELRIGVVAHNLMSLSLQNKQSALQDAAKRRAKDVTTVKSGPLA